MKKLMYLALLAVGVTGCSVEERMNMDVQEINFEASVVEPCGDATTHNYVNNFGTIMGNVEVTNDADYLYVKITSSTENGLKNAHLDWAATFDDFGASPGTLPPGKMTKGDEHSVTSYTFVVDLDEITTDCIFIAARAIFPANTGDHWAGDIPAGNENNPWLYFQYCIQPCPPIPPVIICETAFMEGNRPFLGKNLPYPLNLGNTRWGWAYYHSGGDAIIREELWAGAGKNEISNARLVGWVTTTINGTAVTVSIDMLDEYEDALNLTHIYFSSNQPTTSAPGQYGNSDDSPYDEKVYPFELEDEGDSFWLIVHAEVCQEE